MGLSVSVYNFNDITLKNLHIINKACGKMFNEIFIRFNEKFSKEDLPKLKACIDNKSGDYELIKSKDIVVNVKKNHDLYQILEAFGDVKLKFLHCHEDHFNQDNSYLSIDV